MLTPSLREPAEKITTVIYDWLEAEVATSSKSDDVNAVLNDYSRAIRGLKGGFEHKDNFTWNKVTSHISRLENDFANWSSVTPESPEFDFFAAKVIFDGLMQVSGSYRNQCYVEAADSVDYVERRRKVIGINIQNSVVNRLADLVSANGSFENARISREGLSSKMDVVNEVGEMAVKHLCSRVTLGYDLGEVGSRSAQEMTSAQYNWLNFSLDALILTAKCKNGRIEEAPFLEPRSITEQSGKLHFPLAEPIDWAEALAA